MPLFLSERSLLDKPVFLGKTFDEFANGGSGDIELPGGSADFLVSICVEEAEYSCDERVSEDRKRTDPARQKRMIWMRACFAWTTKDRDPENCTSVIRSGMNFTFITAVSFHLRQGTAAGAFPGLSFCFFQISVIAFLRIG